MTLLVDSFTDTDGTALESHGSSWTRVDGAAGALAINASNQLKSASSTESAYTTDTGSTDHYCKASIKVSSTSLFPLVCRAQDRSNFGASMRLEPNLIVRSRSAGSFTTLYNHGAISPAHDPADVWELRVVGTGSGAGQVYRNGSAFGSSFSVSAFSSSTLVGIIARTNLHNPFIDDWESDAVSSGTTYNDTLSDTVTGGDTLDAAATMAGALSDSVTGGDTMAASVTFAAAFGDTLAGADTMAGDLGGDVISDAVTASDSFDVTLTVAASVSDSVAASDTIEGAVDGEEPAVEAFPRGGFLPDDREERRKRERAIRETMERTLRPKGTPKQVAAVMREAVAPAAEPAAPTLRDAVRPETMEALRRLADSATAARMAREMEEDDEDVLLMVLG